MKPTEPDEPEEPREATDDELGARQVRAVMISLMGIIVLASLLSGLPLMGALFWIAILAFFWVSMSSGRGWARWAVVGLAGLYGAGNAYYAVTSFGAAGYAWTLNAGLTVVCAWCVFILVMSPKVQAYLVARRAAKSKPR